MTTPSEYANPGPRRRMQTAERPSIEVDSIPGTVHAHPLDAEASPRGFRHLLQKVNRS